MITKTKFSNLWIFAILNYLYCDVVGLMDANLLCQFLTGNVNGMEMSPSLLLSASILMELPILMVLLSNILPHKINRRANISIGLLMTFVQIATIWAGMPTMYYLFFSIIEIGTTGYIVYLAYKWKNIT